MVTELRERYNANWTPAKYQAFLDDIARAYDHRPNFRIAETPVFIPHDLQEKLLSACDYIARKVNKPKFKDQSKAAILHPSQEVPGEDYHARFIQIDFGICKDANGELVPQLIEIQGFPSLYFFQDQLAKMYRKHFDIPEEFNTHPGLMDSESYLSLLREVIVGHNNPKNVVLLEIEPQKQVTAIDFLGAQHHLGIKVLSIGDLIKKDKKLYYRDVDGTLVPIDRIYNRVIFDELVKRKDIEREFYFHDEVDVEWVGHPSWFFRISKHTLPMLKHPYIPESFYLDKLKEYPDDLSQFVLKPLYSFAGSGVKFNPTPQELDAIEDKSNFILQKKVNYEPIVQTPDDPSKLEIRMMMIWQKGHPQAVAVNNLVRLSKGEMVGVRYNKDKEWVGASIGFFEPEK